jgi:hypothetical protein
MLGEWNGNATDSVRTEKSTPIGEFHVVVLFCLLTATSSAGTFYGMRQDVDRPRSVRQDLACDLKTWFVL